jgi:protein-disulfide isomerase
VLGFVAILGAVAATAMAADPGASELDAAIERYFASNPDKLGKALEVWLKAHPEIIRAEVEAELARRAATKAASGAARRQVADAKAREAIERDRAAIFSSRHQITVNPAGARTLVAFTDYNCGYCRRGFSDVLQLMKDDAGLRVIIKELPVLGARSQEAAEAAIAARLQDPGGERMLALHRRLMEEKGAVDRTRVLAVAAELGFDAASIEKNLNSPEVKASLEETARLAGELGIRGTPSYVVGNDVVRGAAGPKVLKEKIEAAAN